MMLSLYAHDPFQAVQGALATPWLDGPMSLVSTACEGWALFLVAAAWILALRRSRRETLEILLGVLVALLLAGLCCQVVKALLDHPRPLAVLGPASVRVVGERLYLRSLPSGHSAAVASVAAAAIARCGRRAWPLAVLAFVGGLSRVYVGAHWVFDVAAGWTVGILAGLSAGQLAAAARDAALARWPEVSARLAGLEPGRSPTPN